MDNKFPKFKKGFTLVEMIIAIFIMVIMAGVFFVSQSGNKSQEEVEVAARQVASQLRSLQNEALNGKKIGNETACIFRFDTLASSNRYRIRHYNCSGTLLDSLFISLNSGKGNVIMGSSVVTVRFRSPWGIIDIGGNSKITFASTANTNTRASVCICSSGNIFEQKDDSSCTGTNEC